MSENTYKSLRWLLSLDSWNSFIYNLSVGGKRRKLIGKEEWTMASSVLFWMTRWVVKPVAKIGNTGGKTGFVAKYNKFTGDMLDVIYL